MGNLDMFDADRGARADLCEERLDRFLAATVAFGHSGFLVTEGGERTARRSYAMTRPLHRRYCLSEAVDIQHADANGRFKPTSRALASDAVRRSQVAVRYSDGTCVIANGHRTARLRGHMSGRDVDLPPNGFLGWTEAGTAEVIAADPRGARADYAAAPDLIYTYEVILPIGGSAGFAVPATRTTTLDADRHPVGPAELRRSRGLVEVMPITNALSYRLEFDPTVPAPPELTAERFEVVPGERVRVNGHSIREIVIPPDVPIGRHLGRPVGDGWLDVLVVAPVVVSLQLENEHTLAIAIEPRAPKPIEGTVVVNSQSDRRCREPGRAVHLRHAVEPPATGGWRRIPIEVTAGSWRVTTGAVLFAAREHRSLADLPSRNVALMRPPRRRGGRARPRRRRANRTRCVVRPVRMTRRANC